MVSEKMTKAVLSDTLKNIASISLTLYQRAGLLCVTVTFLALKLGMIAPNEMDIIV